MNCPSYFDSAKFRFATESELQLLKSFLDMNDLTAFVFYANASNTLTPVPFVICAESVSFHKVNVSYNVASKTEDA